MAKGGHALALFKSLFGASNDFWPSMERLHATSRWPTDYAKKQLLVRPMSKKIGYFSEFSMHCRSVCGLCWCSVMQRTRSCVSQHWFGDNLLGTDWVCGYSQLGYLVTWQILTVTRSVERWCDIGILTVTTGNTQNMAHPLEPLGTNVEERSASVIIFQNPFSYSQTVMQGSNLAT